MKLKEENFNLIKKMYLDDYIPVPVIAKYFNVSVRPIYDFLRRENILRDSKTTQIERISKNGNKKLGRKKFININKLIQLYESGKSIKELSLIFTNYSISSLYLILKENNVIFRKSGFKNVSKYDVTLIINMYDNNKSIKEIATNFSCSESLILYHLRRNNVKIRSELKYYGFLNKKHSEISIQKMKETKRELIKNDIINYKSGEEHHLFGKKLDFEHKKKIIESRMNMSYDMYEKYIGEYKIYYNKVINITEKQNLKSLKDYNKRGKAGIKNAYQLDHKYSIYEGFKNGIDPEIIGNINNLEFIPYEENIKKHKNCSINIETLLNLIHESKVK